MTKFEFTFTKNKKGIAVLISTPLVSEKALEAEIVARMAEKKSIKDEYGEYADINVTGLTEMVLDEMESVGIIDSYEPVENNNIEIKL